MGFIKYLALCVVVAVVFASPGIAQTIPGIHQVQWERHRDAPTNPALIGDRSAPIQPLKKQHAKSKGPQATVFGFLPYWSTDEYLRYDLLTHIAAFSVEVNENGSLGNDHGWPWVNLINKAHSQGVKVILVATLFDGNKIDILLGNPTYRANFFVNIKNKMLEGSADGLNVDFESLNPATRGQMINDFMAELTTYLHNELPGTEVTFDGPAVNWGNNWDFLGLSQSCDGIFVMGYAFAGSWSGNSGANAPLQGGSINITNTVLSQYLEVTLATPEKLILGVPYYGHHWKTTTDQPRATAKSFVGSVFYDPAFAGSQTYGLIWDNQSQTPWYRWHDGSDWNQVWFDNDSSLALKYDLALAENLQGVGVWALGYDGDQQELWNLLDLKFGSGQQPPPTTPIAARVLGHGPNSLRVACEPSSNATGYFAYLSSDGLTYPDSVFMAGPDGVLPNLSPGSLYFIKIRAVNASGLSPATQVLAGVPSTTAHQALIVNGFDRIAGTNNSQDYIRQHAFAFHQYGLPFSSTTNEAIFRDQLSLTEFAVADWILGDESTADDTFNQLEQERVKIFLQGGGSLFVSGAEIGWDLERGSTADRNFYADYLKADYIADAPDGQNGTYYRAEPLSGLVLDGVGPFDFDNGSHGTFDVDWPDAIKGLNGGVNCLRYINVNLTLGGAGIQFDGVFPGGTAPGKLIHLAVPFETIYPEDKRFQIMDRILDFFAVTTAVEELATRVPGDFRLEQNYPNPFNPTTTIHFSLPGPGRVDLVIFNSLGQQVFTQSRTLAAPGRQALIWNGRDQHGLKVSSGTYIYRAIFTDGQGIRQIQSRKMVLLE